MRNDLSGRTFDARLKAAQAEGVTGRKELLEKLARMPIEKVAGLPASSLAILGPQGLARLAAMREELAGAGRKAAATVKPARNASTVTPIPPRASHPIRSTAVAVALILAAGLLFDLARPWVVWSLLDSGDRPRETALWPACPRLDVHVDGCIYTSAGNLTLRRVSDMTGMPLDQVLAANRHLSAHPDAALPRNSRIVIWRGRLRLEGGSR